MLGKARSLAVQVGGASLITDEGMPMIHTLKTILAAGASTLFIAGCSTAPTETAQTKTPDPRQGAEVRNICFQSQIRNWKALDDRSVIVEKNFKEEYKLDLIGTCQPRDAFTSIGLISRVGGGSCLETGDKLVTDARYNDGSCSIRRIYEWHKDAGKTPAEGAATPSGS
jgi:hypothetical protein